MNILNTPAQARIPIGSVIVNGRQFEVTINLEWAKYFDLLNTTTNSNTASLQAVRSNATVGALTGGEGIEVEFIPGPQGLQGARGDLGAALGLLIEAPEAPDLVPGPPGPAGRQGDPGPALFLLHDNDGGGETFMVAPLPATEGFIAPTLLNGWADFGGSYNPAGYYKDRFGVVHLRGLVKSGTVGAAIFTLPAGYCPANKEVLSSISNGAIGYYELSNTGNMVLIAGSNVYASLDGLTFRAA